jgi:hypothetical protein
MHFEAAPNYNPAATNDDGSCELGGLEGCTYVEACNYTEAAEVDDGSCTFAEQGTDCEGNVLGAGTCVGDLNNSGVVESTDLLLLLSNFGVECD